MDNRSFKMFVFVVVLEYELVRPQKKKQITIDILSEFLLWRDIIGNWDYTRTIT